jgi:hypothetical protein
VGEPLWIEQVYPIEWHEKKVDLSELARLRWILFKVRNAQIKLIIDSKASKWSKALTLPSRLENP